MMLRRAYEAKQHDDRGDRMNVKTGLQRVDAMAKPLAETTEVDWVNAMGRKPVSIAAMPGNQRLLQWRSGTYVIQRVAVMFGPDHKFRKITSRYQC